MAVKKTTTSKKEEVAVTTPVEEVITPEVEIEVAEAPVEKQPSVEVDMEDAKIKESDKPNSLVKIRMRVDHKCCIAMERYDLKAGKTYNVPENVKYILNKAGLLAPL